MSTMTQIESRPVPKLGGFSLKLLSLEARRVLRNRRTVIFTLIFPAVLFASFGLNSAYAHRQLAHGNLSAALLVTMGLYGAMLASASGGAMVSIERAQGWSRQLRLTPLSPVAYVLLKTLVAMLLGAMALLACYTFGAVTGQPQMPVHVWVETGLISWIGALTFAALGLFAGYLLPGENVMQILGPGMAVLAFLGGLFVRIPSGSTMDHIASFTPMYGLSRLAKAPVYGGDVHVLWVVNLLAWTAVFVVGAVWRMRRDTSRV
ncbi:MAG: ABC transporter permease [Nocardioidaceae bacterium]